MKAEALGDRAQIESFEQEAVKMSQLRPHQNVVTLYGVCQSPLSIVTEFAGPSLSIRIRIIVPNIIYCTIDRSTT